MQKSGRARADQPTSLSAGEGLLRTHQTSLTNGHDIAEPAQLPEVEVAFSNLLTACNEVDKDRAGVTHGQANNTDTREGVEGSRGTEVDESKRELHNHDHHHGIEGYIKFLVDLLPPFGSGNSAVTCESPSTSRRSSRTPDTAEQRKDEQGDKQSDTTAGGANRRFDDHGRGLCGDKSGKVRLVRQNEDEWDEKNKPCDGIENDGDDHSFRDLCRRLLHFLAHSTRCQRRT